MNNDNKFYPNVMYEEYIKCADFEDRDKGMNNFISENNTNGNENNINGNN